VERILLRHSSRFTFPLKSYDPVLLTLDIRLPAPSLLIVDLKEWKPELAQWNHPRLRLQASPNVGRLFDGCLTVPESSVVLADAGRKRSFTTENFLQHLKSRSEIFGQFQT
jgi:hypothetical protein